VEIRRVAILAESPVKELFPFLTRGSYLIFEVYNRQERLLFEIPQNRLSTLFLAAKTPYEPLLTLWTRLKSEEKPTL
jgi:hypothetical protein